MSARFRSTLAARCSCRRRRSPRRCPTTPRRRRPPSSSSCRIEVLLDVEVTSASKRPQALSETAAAISVITGDDIRRSGVRSLPEALRLAAGLHVARFDGRTWAISARGFNIARRQQAAGADRRPQRLHAAVLGRVLGRAEPAARGRRAHRGDPRPRRHAVGRQRRQRRHQRHHPARRPTPRATSPCSPPATRSAPSPPSATAAPARRAATTAPTPSTTTATRWCAPTAASADDPLRIAQAGFRADRDAGSTAT